MNNIPFGFLQARDGIRLRYGHWPHQGKSHRGAVVVLGGRAEFMEKYIETYGWLAASFEAIETLQQPGFIQGIHTPVLVVTAGQDRVVSNAATKRFVALLPAVHCLSIENAYHEILQEQDGIRAQFWQAFDRFVIH